MQVLDTVVAMRKACRRARVEASGADRLGLVPTMGALHAGHLSLVRRARQECGTVAVSLFVNPTQFGPGEDFDRYPRALERDSAMLAAEGVDLLFAPAVAEMYPAGCTTFVEVGPLGQMLDGASRPGHFRGVATVVSKLLHIVDPEYLYLGQKDAAQVAVLNKMVRDLQMRVCVTACETMREPDGLAMSSRNAYLSPEERSRAAVIPRTLETVRAALRAGIEDTAQALEEGRQMLRNAPGVAPEYLVAVHPETLEPVDTVQSGTLVAVAARVGATRLIDNFLAP